MTATATVAGELRSKLFDVATELFAATNPEVLVAYGRPSRNVPHDLVMILGVESEFEPGAAGSGTVQREETLRVDTQWWFWRPGLEDAEKEATEALYGRLGELERHIRVDDPTLGDLVRRCYLLRHAFDTSEADEKSAGGRGRMAVALATFEAKVRIRNS